MPQRPSMPPGTASMVARAAAPSTGRTATGWRSSARAQRPRRADLDLRGPSRLVAPQPRRGRPLPDLPRARRRSSSPTSRDMGFTHVELMPVTEHPFDGSWGYQPIGLFAPTSRFGDARRISARFVDACHRRGLGVLLDWVPGAFPDRPARPRPLRRHGALRARRSAPGLPPGLEHADLQLRPPRGAQLPARQRALLARRVPHRRPARRCRRLDALPRLQPQGRRVDPQPLRRPREPRGDRLPAAHERAGLRRASPARPRSPRNRPPGRWSRGRPTPAASASATSGTWAGCTTRCATWRTTRSIAATTTTS